MLSICPVDCQSLFSLKSKNKTLDYYNFALKTPEKKVIIGKIPQDLSIVLTL